MPFAPKPIEHTKWEEITKYASEHGAYEASKKYLSQVNLSQQYLYRKLLKDQKKRAETIVGDTVISQGGEVKEDKIVAGYKSRAIGRKEAYEGIELSKKEKKLIKDIEEGRMDIATASRVIAAKAFEKLLKFPDSASFTSFIQSEMLNLKRQELSDKNTWAMELVNRMFAGALPPRVCPHCGYELVKLPVLTGQVIQDVESIPATRDTKG